MLTNRKFNIVLINTPKVIGDNAKVVNYQGKKVAIKL